MFNPIDIDEKVDNDLRRALLQMPVPAASPDFDARVLNAVCRQSWWLALFVWARPALASAACSAIVIGFALHATVSAPVNVLKPGIYTADAPTTANPLNDDSLPLLSRQMQRRLTAELLDDGPDEGQSLPDSTPAKNENRENKARPHLHRRYQSGGIHRLFHELTAV